MSPTVSAFLFFYFNLLFVYGVLDVEQNGPEETVTCVSASGSIAHVSESGDSDINKNGTTIKCKTNHCYAFWKEDPINKSIIILGQGSIYSFSEKLKRNSLRNLSITKNHCASLHHPLEF